MNDEQNIVSGKGQTSTFLWVFYSQDARAQLRHTETTNSKAACIDEGKILVLHRLVDAVLGYGVRHLVNANAFQRTVMMLYSNPVPRSEIVQTTLKAAHRLLIVRTTLIQRLAYVNLLQMLSKVYLQSTRPSWNVAKTIIRGILQPALLRH
jgi:hypothetical protein